MALAQSHPAELNRREATGVKDGTRAHGHARHVPEVSGSSEPLRSALEATQAFGDGEVSFFGGSARRDLMFQVEQNVPIPNPMMSKSM